MDPPSGAVGVSIRQPVRVSFSKPMRKDDVEHAVHFFPSPASPPRLHWEGHDLVVSPDTVWDSAQTYVLTLPTEAMDARGNRLAATYQSAFSTGSHIDTGRITGQVLQSARPAAGAWVLCYKQPSQHCNPEIDSADYVVQTDAEGRFALSFLRTGSYRVFALADRDRDWLWNIGAEELGVPAGDLEVDSAGATKSLPVLHLAALDTVLPALVDCRRVSDEWWALEFDAVWSGAQLDSLSVFEVRGRDTVRLDRPTGNRAGSSRLLAHAGAPETPGTEILLRHARQNRPPEGCVPAVTPTRDSLSIFGPVEILPDTGHTWVCPPAAVILVFDEPVASVSESSFVEAGRFARIRVRSGGPFEVHLVPPWDSLGEGPWVCSVAPGAVRAASGATWPESDTVRISFPLVDQDSAGEYEVRIEGLPHDPEAEVFVELWPVQLREPVCQLPLTSGQPASGRLAGGDYFLSLLSDRDGDQVWSPGWPSPFVPSERLWYPADTLHVRPRFTVEFTLSLVP